MITPKLTWQDIKNACVIKIVDHLPHDGVRNEEIESSNQRAREFLSRPGVKEKLEKIIGRKLPYFPENP